MTMLNRPSLIWAARKPAATAMAALQTRAPHPRPSTRASHHCARPARKKAHTSATFDPTITPKSRVVTITSGCSRLACGSTNAGAPPRTLPFQSAHQPHCSKRVQT